MKSLTIKVLVKKLIKTKYFIFYRLKIWREPIYLFVSVYPIFRFRKRIIEWQMFDICFYPYRFVKKPLKIIH